MVDYTKTFTAAAVQAEPVWLDLDGGVEKTIALACEASGNGASIVAFPETWIPGYPWWIWLDSVAWQSQFVVRYAQNSLELDSSQFERIRQTAADLGIAIALGYSDRVGGSLYMGQALISSTGAVLKTRRKLKPTHVERSVFGDGDGSDLAVVDSEFGRLGALCCAEHLQPLTKYAMFAQQEQLHIAAWPSFSVYEGAAYLLGPEVNTAASQQYAVEGQSFVLAPTGIIGQAAYDAFVDTEAKKELLKLGGGHARIYGPDGRSLASPLAPTEEGILYADIDYREILAAKNAYDPVGHYSRPDVLRLVFNGAAQSRIVNTEVPEAAWEDALTLAPAGDD
ncbi:carbon-nitrogen hydrolase family protein [Pseudarthrobacter albicanus]|uniref:carbon-nitrogen hydrolase family protein n=1 Tax=Pseudarthrobacter albicanus TaxID=2823873 RepID=UPI001BA8536A|nr:carbon-nitrogen hydrolase family protein [Pseudarthrobacter albicanus]